ncbi:hypothetical protein QF031_004047 [Pseudarthrobacter defluvii]|nr:hypothetical protein [Pseudarthrobacter defluvii]
MRCSTKSLPSIPGLQDAVYSFAAQCYPARLIAVPFHVKQYEPPALGHDALQARNLLRNISNYLAYVGSRSMMPH